MDEDESPDPVAIALIKRLLQLGVIEPADLTHIAEEVADAGFDQASHEVLCAITALAPDDMDAKWQRDRLTVISGGKDIDE